MVHDAGTLTLELPPTATDDTGTEITVGGLSSCGLYADAAVTGDIVIVSVDPTCPILPPPPTYLTEVLALGPLTAGDYEVRLFDVSFGPADDPQTPLTHGQLHVYDATGCVPSPTTLCLGDARFRVEVAWQGFQGGSGEGRAIPLPDRDDTGLFWFFDPANVELTVKVLDGCGTNGHYWVFVSSGSTVGYQVTVTDTLHDETWTRSNLPATSPPLVADTAAFATCP